MTTGKTQARPYVEAFVASARDVMHTMAMMDVEVRCIRDLPPDGIACEGGALMDAAGDVRGVIGLVVGRDLAARMVGSIMGKTPDRLADADVRSGILELLNMIAGGAKSRLADTPWHFDVTLPREYAGKRMTPDLFPRPPAAVTIATGGSEFMVVVSLDRI